MNVIAWLDTKDGTQWSRENFYPLTHAIDNDDDCPLDADNWWVCFAEIKPDIEESDYPVVNEGMRWLPALDWSIIKSPDGWVREPDIIDAFNVYPDIAFMDGPEMPDHP